MAASVATVNKPILATYGLANCIAILAYDINQRFAFLSHSDAMSFLYRSDDNLGHPSQSAHIAWLDYELGKRSAMFDLEMGLITGSDPDKKSLEIIKKDIEELRKKLYIISLNLKEINVGDDGSIGIDSRTGKLFSYDPLLNPNKNQKGPTDYLIKSL